MKKIALWVMVAVCVVMGVEPIFAAYSNYSENKAEMAKIESFNKKMEALVEEVEGLASKIAAYNKPVFEVKLAKKERQHYDEGDDVPSLSPVQWNRVWAKGKTIVLGAAKKDKKFWAHFFKTSDPGIVFSNGIRVGASVNVLERYFRDTMKNIGYVKGKNIIICGPYYGESDVMAPTVSIVCQNGIITEIHYDIAAGYGGDGGAWSNKALDFANKQARQMGFSGIRSGLKFAVE